MKNKIIYLITTLFLIFIFLILFKGLNKSNLYEPKSEIKVVPEFFAIDFLGREINSKNIFDKNNFYLVNIWASWCVPCKAEHPYLMNLSSKNEIEIIGLNYKDKKENAKKFLNDLGNPYKIILLDKKGTISIDWGAYGVPETFLVYEKKIIKKFIGPINAESVREIEKILK